MLLLFSLKLSNFLFEVRLTILGLQLLAHSECDRRLVQCLVGSNRHFYLITHSQQQKATNWLSERHLSNDLIETLTEKFLSDRANTVVTGLALHQLLVKHLTKAGNINSGSLLSACILNIVFSCYIYTIYVNAHRLTIFNPLSWWDDRIQDIVIAWFVL